MDFTPTTQCRLCLSTCEDVVNIFGHCNGTTIASVVSKHFWFQIYKNDGFPESLCQACWTYIKTFHDFYKKIEAIQNDYIKSLRDTTLAVTADSIKEEICDSSSNEIPSDLNIVKCEETLAFSLPVITNENAYYNENDLNFEDEYINRQVEKVEPVEPEDDDDDNRADQLNLILNPPCTDSVAKTARRAKLKLPESCAFQCSLCTSAFSKAFDLANHLRSQHHSGKDKTEETIHCEECKKRFVTVSLLTKHIRKVHEGRSPQVCSKCSRVFNSKTACDAHIQLDHNNDDDEPPTKKQHKDEIETVEKISNVDEGDCDEAVKRSSYLPVRSREEKDKENALIREYFNMVCNICNEEFSTFIEVRKHYRSAHKIGGYIVCCGKRFHRRYRVLSHIHHHMNPNAFRCEQCNKSFQDKVALQMHIKNHSLEESNSFQCTLCNCKFMKRVWLIKHMRKLHQSSEKSRTEKTFECDSCKKSFSTKPLLVGHIRRIHQQAEKQICDICARVCSSKSSLRYHMLEHSKTTPEPEEQCHICGNWLKHQKGLRKHIARHHDDFVDCPICKKRIQNKQALNGHMRSAHGERTHQCTLCDKAFKTRLILKEHIASHTGVDLYKCQYCPKTFKSSANLYSHRKKMHFDEWNRDYPKRCVKLAKTSNIECTDV